MCMQGVISATGHQQLVSSSWPIARIIAVISHLDKASLKYQSNWNSFEQRLKEHLITLTQTGWKYSFIYFCNEVKLFMFQ